MRTSTRVGRAVAVAMASLLVVGASLAIAGTSSARTPPRVARSTCEARPWGSAAYRSARTPSALAVEVLACLKLEAPTSYRHDEVGIVSLNASAFFQNVNEFGLTSTVQRQMARLGMPPITLEDGPGGLITKTSPAPTLLPNELALGATFNTALATTYGDVLGAQAHQLGYDGVQAPDLNLVRVPSWGRAAESFGESPVLAGEMGAAEAVAIESNHEISVLKHFGPYSQETDRRELNQLVSAKAYHDTYIRPFTIVLHALLPQLAAGGHAVAIMCSYGNVNDTKACRSPELSEELDALGVNALVRSDLDVKVDPSALLLSGVDLIKPMDARELDDALGQHAVQVALDAAVTQIFRTEFADGLVNGTTTSAQPHRLTGATVATGRDDAQWIEEHAAVLLKNTDVLPLRPHAGPVAVVGDLLTDHACGLLASSLGRALARPSLCVDTARRVPKFVLFAHLPVGRGVDAATRVMTFRAPASGPYVASVTTWGNTELRVDGAVLVASHGLAEYQVQRTALVGLTKGARYTFRVSWHGAPPSVWLLAEQPAVDAAVRGVRGATCAVVVAYDLPREGMDRSSLDLPGAQEAIISAVAAKVPTIVLLATDGATKMPWLRRVRGVLEVWNPTGVVATDRTLSRFVTAYTNLLDGAVDPSGRLPETFPVSAAGSPMAVQEFWPGYYSTVNLDLPPQDGVGIGYDWYRAAGWPVLFPFGFGLSYTRYQLLGGALTDTSTGALRVSVAVRDAGGVEGTEPVQLYADWPTDAGEPRALLVGFGTATFSRANALAGTVKHVDITVSPDALSTYDLGAMHVDKGTYCLEASTFDGDPHSWSTGPITLGPTASGGIIGPSDVALSQGSCP